MPDGQHVLVKIAAASVNPLDAKVRAANHVFPEHLPNILGCDGAGTVAAIGGAVTRFRRGDEVYFFNGGVGGEIPGTYAEYTLVPEAYLARKPKTATMVEAAALPLVLITAWESLVYRGGLEPGQKVLIHGATGGVGHVAIQLARHLRGRVAASVGDEDKGDYARELGAELVIPYGMRDFVESILDWTDGEGVDLVLDPVGGDVFARSCAATRIYGRVVTIVGAPVDAKLAATARLRNLLIGYQQMSAPLITGNHRARLAQTRILEQGARLFDRGKLKVKVSHVLPLAQTGEAHRIIERGHTLGKIVLTVSE
jgi:NADPH2:quinone reductase